MGQAATKAREIHAKPKIGSNVTKQKIANATATGVLSLKESKLHHIPKDIFKLYQLKVLDLSINQLKELPDEVRSFNNLKTLNLRQNKLNFLPDLSSLENLTNLSLDDNGFKTISILPPNLLKLSITGNQLTVLSSSICSLKKLESLDVSNNQIKELPGNIDQLREIKELILDKNYLNISKCLKLKTLSLRSNLIAAKGVFGNQSIAVEVLRDCNINILNLHNNPLNKLEFQSMDGFDAFMERRKQLKDKEIQGGLQTDSSVCGLD